MSGNSAILGKFVAMTDLVAGGYVPPDNALAVGPDGIVMAENSAIAFCGTNGNITSILSFASFYPAALQYLGSADSQILTDPRAVYDAASGHFIVTDDAVSNDPNSKEVVSSILVAVSKDANPADGWTFTSIPTSTSTPVDSWGDQPALATDGTNVFFGTSNFYNYNSPNSGFYNSVADVVSLNGLVAAASVSGGTPPAHVSSTLAPSQIFQVAAETGNGAFYIANDVDALSVVFYADGTGFGPTSTVALGNIDQGLSSMSVAQKGTTQLLDAGDGRVNSAVTANGCLYAVFDVTPTSGPDAGQPTVHWVKLNVSDPNNPVLVAQGDISGSQFASGTATFNASVAVDGNGDLLINFVASGTNMLPTDYYVVHHAGTADGVFDAPVAYQSSAGAMDYGTGSTPGRWGDYSSAVADSSNAGAFWISNEYALGSGADWGTTVAHVVVGDGVTASQASAAQAASPMVVSDSAGNVAADLNSLESLAAAGKLGSILLTDPASPTITVTAAQLASDGKALAAISGPYALSVDGVSAAAAFVSQQNADGRGANGIAVDYAGAAPTGGNSVVGWQNAAFTGGANALVLDDGRSHYAVQVDETGNLAIVDNDTGQSISVTGDRYVVFNGGSDASPGVYDQIMFIETGADATLARLYTAAFGRAPDLPGLEYWQHLQDTGAQSTDNIAVAFVDSQEFQARFGANTTDVQFLTALYQNVLGRAPDAGGLAYWEGSLSQLTATDGSPMARALVLLDFANSQECLNDVGSWLVDTSKGGYADPQLLLPAQTVVNQAAQDHYLNTALIDGTALGSGSASATGFTVDGPGSSYGGAVSLSGAGGDTLVLSPVFTNAGIRAGYNNIVAATATGTIWIDSGTGNTLSLAPGGVTTVYLNGGSGTRIIGFTPGAGSTLGVFGQTTTPLQLLDGSTYAINGRNLSFATTDYVINIGNIGGGSAAEVATAANKAYAVADTNGSALSGTPGENLVFMGLDNGGNTEFWTFKNANPSQSADLNGNHLVDANEVGLLATVVGVAPASLKVTDLQG